MHTTLKDAMSVRRSVSSNFQRRISLFWGLQWLITAPTQPHATEIAVYTALFLSPIYYIRDNDIKEAVRLKFNLIEAMKKGGFNLSKW